MILLLLVKYVVFPERKDAIVKAPYSSNTNLKIEASGSIGLHYQGKCNPTYPNETLNVNEKLDWCSNVGSEGNMPWIQFSFTDSQMKVKGYSIRNGCCWYSCCCLDDNTDIYGCCCRLYSFSLHGSDDNVTWTQIHEVKKEDNFWLCLAKTYEFPETRPYKYIRLRMDENYPGCVSCFQINEIQILGTKTNSFLEPDNANDEDESVSIIGKVKHNE